MKAKEIITEKLLILPDINDKFAVDMQGNIAYILTSILNKIPNGTDKQYFDELITEAGNILDGKQKREATEPISICQQEVSFLLLLHTKITDIAHLIQEENGTW